MKSHKPIFVSSAGRPDPVPRLLSAAALLVAVAALIFSMNGAAPAASSPATARATAEKQQKQAEKKQKQSAKKQAAALDKKFAALNKKVSKLSTSCPVSGAIDLGSWCLEGSTFKVPTSEIGQNSYFYAAQKCVKEGGWLPSAAQLIGAAPVVALKSTIDDDPGTSGASEFPEAANGIKDEREMTSDLFTTGAGSRAAGSEGVTAGSKGVQNIGEPNPVPMPAEPSPGTLDYVTVYDNHNMGGFAGGEAVGKAENFRCAYAEGYQGKPRDISSRS
ncbi:MAG TPA: hypothetical protein VGH14_10075 [Solirubrobacterales bacterium]|jgi:hypothetical protein